MKKEEAIKLRMAGQSYNEISKKLNVPKGTLSYWFKDLAVSEDIKRKNISAAKRKWSKSITDYNKKRSKIARRRWAQEQTEAAVDIKPFSLNDLKLVGAALYWAEGYKRGNWNVIFSNADPRMHKLMMKFFIKICGVPIDKIKAQVQTHHNVSVPVALKYWSGVIGLPMRQFLKTNISISKSSKFKRGNRLPFGTLRIKIDDVRLVNRIKGWIIGLIKRY